MASKPEIDLAIVAGCRPDLLSTTLESFSGRLFSHFTIRNLAANIDPILGSASDGDACEKILRDAFESVSITRPETPSFGRAVKSVWERTGDIPVLHMEDDWIALHDITPDMILPHLTPDVGQVALSQRDRKPQEPDYAIRTEKLKFLGLTVLRRRFNGYGTSPRFIAAGLAKKFALLLDPTLDPEKQILHGLNKPLSKFQQQFKCKLVWGPNDTALIEDIGRDWRESRNIRKVYRHGEVSWVSESQPD